MSTKRRFPIGLPQTASRGRDRAHRVFHPLCGATLPVLLQVLPRGGVVPARAYVAAIALATATLRLPFTLAEAAYVRTRIPAPGAYPAPVFIVGHWRSGTTHLANLLSRGGAFGILSPIAVGLPAEALGLARVVRPFIDQFFPSHRLIDEMTLAADLPQEDELAMANLSTLSSLHGIYFPATAREAFDRALFGRGVGEREQQLWDRRLERYVAKLTSAAGGRPLLIRNPASSTRIERLLRIWPGARFIHIHRDPAAVYGSSVRMFDTLLRELSLGRPAPGLARDLVRHVYPRVMEALLAAGASLPEGRFTAVAHADLERDPAGTIRRIHARLDLPATREGWAAMDLYAARHARAARHHPLAADDLAFLARYRDLLGAFGYAPERSGSGTSPQVPALS